MSSFEELLVRAQRQNDFDIIYNALLDIVMNQSDHYSLCNKLQPFLQYVNDGGSLNALYTQLQNPYNNNEVVVKTLVHNVVNASKSNDNLKKVLEVVLGIRV
jgi:hypothetical protein